MAVAMERTSKRFDITPDREWTSGCLLTVSMYLEEGFPVHTIAEVLNRNESDVWAVCGAEGIPVPRARLRWGVYTCVRPVLVRAFQRKGEAEQYRRKLHPPSQFKVARL